MPLIESITIVNNTSEKIDVNHVVDTSISPISAGEMRTIIDPGEQVVFFKRVGVSYVVGHSQSVYDRTVKREVLKDGTVRTDAKDHNPREDLKSSSVSGRFSLINGVCDVHGGRAWLVELVPTDEKMENDKRPPSLRLCEECFEEVQTTGRWPGMEINPK